MTPAHVVVMGGGPAGLAAALVLARSGHRVTLVERDRLDATSPDLAFHWDRRGIPHFMQPHALIPRGRQELRDNLPDVYESLLAAGAHDADLRRQLPGDVHPDDEVLQYVAVRRPLVEWALLRAVRREPGVRTLHGSRVTGLRVAAGRVVGVDVDGSEVEADVVADASGRRTARREWLGAAGLSPAPDRVTDCGVVYYCRYYRQRPGFELPPPKSLLSPRGDLGYLGYASFPGDNRTFAGLLAVPTGVTQWRVLKDAPAFEAAVAEIPALRAWVDPDGVDPITDVLPMAGLRNSLASYDPSAPVGLFPLGDALCHTDPVLAHGLSFALIHARELASALASHHDDLGDAGRAYGAAVLPLAEERFELASALDEQRHRMWTGGAVDVAHRTGDYALFTVAAGAAAAMVDPDVFRVIVRRIGLLDSTAVLDRDVQMQQRIEDLFAQLLAVPRPAPGPARESMLETATAAGAR
jgi:2-polyprenyl-6-methoxyphenol hydroxylase-like FAD-dependent oxidoreductase